MLMMIGPLQFRIAPFNATEYTHTHGATFVEKPVMGVRQPLEWTGNGPETFTIRAILFPARFGDGGGLAILTALRFAGLPQYMIRGDFALLGWVVIEGVKEKATYLDTNGVGRVIEVDIDLRRSGPPTPEGFFAALSGMFTGILG